MEDREMYKLTLMAMLSPLLASDYTLIRVMTKEAIAIINNDCDCETCQATVTILVFLILTIQTKDFKNLDLLDQFVTFLMNSEEEELDEVPININKDVIN